MLRGEKRSADVSFARPASSLRQRATSLCINRTGERGARALFGSKAAQISPFSSFSPNRFARALCSVKSDR